MNYAFEPIILRGGGEGGLNRGDYYRGRRYASATAIRMRPLRGQFVASTSRGGGKGLKRNG